MTLFSSGISGGATVTRQAQRSPSIPSSPNLDQYAGSRQTGGPSTVSGDPPPSNGGVTDPGELDYDPAEVIAQLENAFPWLSQIGLSVQWLRDTAVEVAGNADLFLQTLRQTPQYTTRFPALRRSDGTLRMNEAQYLQMEDGYRQLLRQYGIPEDTFKRPQDLVGLFESEQDTEELRQRLQVYQGVRDAGDPIRDAFYVYSGINLSVDDLFEAIVDENVGRQLQADYLAASSNGLDYETFINRTTEVALDRLAQAGGSLPANATPENVRSVLDVLYSNSDDGAVLGLEELLSAFEAAQFGSSATAAGLELPELERVNEFRAKGIEAAQAKNAYLQYSLQGGGLSADAQRAGVGAIGQSRFEDAVFLGDEGANRALQTASAYGAAVGNAGGGFQFQADRLGGIRQSGLS